MQFSASAFLAFHFAALNTSWMQAMVPRGSYLTLLSDVLKEFFAPATPSLVDELWFECAESGAPLKWHYPCGVLFDMHGDVRRLPWNVIVHFQGFPAAELLRCPNDDVVKNHYTNVLVRHY